MLARKQLANAIRALSMDAVQKANSGHPGMPMGMADIAEVLWNDFLQHNPANPKWPNRDRFVLSNGHGSMLQYSLLHLSGYDLSIEDLKQFRQLHSKTPGHPEYGYTPGVETTTGPLGQGLANAVGMALAEKVLAAHFNRPSFDIVDHNTYVFFGDGCLMEGISHEVCSLAGTLGLNKLIAFWDDNGISIDGEVEGWFTDDTVKRFEAYNWQVIAHVDGHDAASIKAAIEKAKAEPNRPTLICCKTVIGYGAPNKQGTESAHGAPLGNEEVAAVRKMLNWDYPAFEIPAEIKQAWDAKAKGQSFENQWNDLFTAYLHKHPELAKEFKRRIEGLFPSNWQVVAKQWLIDVDQKAETIATRKASQNAINLIAPLLPELMGGSADLAASNLTLWKGSKPVSKTDANGNYIYYGVREFGMSAIANGMALHAGLIPYTATFLVFSDYARNAIRMSALMKQRQIFVFTHDSIGLGEDGPTHQPVEHVASLRLIPNLQVWRPCDAVESLASWLSAIERTDGPSCLIFSRQNLPHMIRDADGLENIRKGGYILKACQTKPNLILLATGSEIELAMKAAAELAHQYQVSVVSMPCVELFKAQTVEYQNEVLPNGVPVVAIEAGVTHYWHGLKGVKEVVGIDQFGESAPAKDLFNYFGFTVENIIMASKRALQN